MKKKLLAISVLSLGLATSAMAFSACGEQQQESAPSVQPVEYTITFDAVGGSTVESQTYFTYQYLVEPEQPVKSGFRFDGWYWDENYSKEFVFEGNTMIASDITVYAKWIEYYTLTFNTDGATAVEPIIVEQGQSAVAPQISKDGYVFTGWFADASKTQPFDFDNVTSNATVYAGWRNLQQNITVSYYCNNLINSSDDTFEQLLQNEGEEASAQFASQFESVVNTSDDKVFVFNYWSLDSEGRQPINGLIPQSEQGALSLYAQWIVSAGYCSVTFMGGNSEKLTVYVQKNTVGNFASQIAQYYGSEVTDFVDAGGLAFNVNNVVERNLVLTPAQSVSDWTFEVNGAGYAVTGYSGTETRVVIPSSYNGLPVNAVAKGAFIGSSITSVTIPDSVTSIGADAFSSTALTSVVGGKHISYVGINAFSGTSIGYESNGLIYLNQDCRVVLSYQSGSTVNIPSSVVAIAESAFSGAEQLNSVIFASGSAISALPANAFYGCSNLSSINADVLPLISVGDGAFRNCTSLSSISLPSSVSEIGEYAFAGCTSLGECNFGSATTIGVYAFAGCAFTSLNLSGLMLRDIAEGTFSGNTSLEEITLPATLRTIGARAFENCSAMTKLTVNASTGSLLTSIGEGAFGGCSVLRTVILFGCLNNGQAIEIVGGASAFADCADDLVVFVIEGAPNYDTSDRWYNAAEDAMYTYVQIYSQLYQGITFLEGEAVLPVISMPVLDIMYSQSDEKITAKTDVLALLVENGLTATDNSTGEITLSIDSVTFMLSGTSTVIEGQGTVYDLTTPGVYKVVVRATDRFGNSCFEMVRIAIVK